MTRPASRFFFVAFMVAALVLASRAAVPQSEDLESAARYRDGLTAFEAGDYDGAYVFWKPLAENGYAVAQYSLAKLYERGGGAILKNPVLYRWCSAPRYRARGKLCCHATSLPCGGRADAGTNQNDLFVCHHGPSPTIIIGRQNGTAQRISANPRGWLRR